MTIKVPKGIRYINQWENFSLPTHPCIINKQITGCGFTEYCLTNKDNVILCSPRKILLENKEEQHSGDVLYAKSGLDTFVNFEKDLTTGTKRPDKDKESDLSNEEIKDIITKFKNSIQQYYQTCVMNNKPCKILVTYDSFRHVKSALGDSIKYFYVVIDEFQSVFTDAKFKSTTEIEFISQLQGIQNLSFVSATPMLDKYLEMLDEFKDLPYYEMDWETEDPSRISIPKLNVHSCSRSVLPAAQEIIQEYLDGKFETTVIIADDNSNKNIESREAVLYVNSVKNICDIISKCGLTLDNTNVLCANTEENELKILKAFGYKSLKNFKDITGLETCLGKVPTKDQPRKMFTLCTRTVYLGADFYSDNARTFIFSDANIDSLTVDITIDLPQILGRQRLEENPWKNRAELYYKTLNKDKGMTQEDFDNLRAAKQKKTENLLLSYKLTTEEAKHDLAEAYQNLSKTFNYKNDYVAVNTHGGADLIPVFNNLVMINDMRSYEIQQVDYKDRFRVFNALGKNVEYNSIIQQILETFNSLRGFTRKMKYLYSLNMTTEIAKQVLNNVYDTCYAKYYWTIPANRAGTLNYLQKNLEIEYNNKNREKTENTEDRVKNTVLTSFSVNVKYSKSEAKEKLGKIYTDLGYNKTPKANDLEQYFELKECKVLNLETGKRDAGFEIIKQKEE